MQQEQMQIRLCCNCSAEIMYAWTEKLTETHDNAEPTEGGKLILIPDVLEKYKVFHLLWNDEEKGVIKGLQIEHWICSFSSFSAIQYVPNL